MRNVFKYSLGFVAIICFGLAILFFVLGWKDGGSGAEKEYAEQIKNLEEQYKNDTYGGNTPEETLNLFIAALKKGDTDLASKYFVVEKQGEWKGKLEETRKNSNLESFIILLQNVNLSSGGKISEDSYQFSETIDNKSIPWVISLTKNTFTNKWKIVDL